MVVRIIRLNIFYMIHYQRSLVNLCTHIVQISQYQVQCEAYSICPSNLYIYMTLDILYEGNQSLCMDFSVVYQNLIID